MDNAELIQRLKDVADSFVDAWNIRENRDREALRIYDRRATSNPPKTELDELAANRDKERSEAFGDYVVKLMAIGKEASFIQNQARQRLNSGRIDSAEYKNWELVFHDISRNNANGFDPQKAARYLNALASMLPLTTPIISR